MAVITALAVGIWYARGRPLPASEAVEPPAKDNRKFLAALAAFTVVYLVAYKTLLAFSPDFAFAFWNELPLQPCNVVAVLAIPASLLRGRIGRLLKGFCFYGGIVFAPVALVMPVDGFSGVPLLSVNAIGFYGFHGLVLALSVSFGTLKVYRPRWRDIPGVLLVLVLLALPVHGVNMLLRATVYPEANYFYTYGLEGNPLLQGLKGWIPIPLVYELPLLPVMGILCAVINLLFQAGWKIAAVWRKEKAPYQTGDERKEERL